MVSEMAKIEMPFSASVSAMPASIPMSEKSSTPLDAEALPPAVSLNNVRRDIAGGAYQGVLFIRLADEAVLCAQIYQRVVLHLAYGELPIELLQFHGACPSCIPIPPFPLR